MIESIVPGQSVSWRDFNAVAESMNRMLRPAGSGTMDLGVGPDGMVLNDFTRRPHWAVIGAARSGNKYAHTRIFTESDGRNVTMTTADEQFLIAGTIDDFPAIERNGRSDVPAGTVVALFPDEFNGACFNFAYFGEASYPYPGPYGSYDSGPGGTSWRYETWTRVLCDGAGTYTQDHLRYTTTLLIRRSQPFSMTVLEVLEEDVPVITTECKEFVTDVSVSSATCNEDGTISIGLTKTKDKVRGVICGSCP